MIEIRVYAHGIAKMLSQVYTKKSVRMASVKESGWFS